MQTLLPQAWQAQLADYLASPAWAALTDRVEAAYQTETVYPPRAWLFTAFHLTPPEAVRVVILGQDPYHEAGQAMGLSFSVPEGTPLPRSLKNIYRERESDLGVPPSASGDLTDWARQGVFMLNTVLTVAQGQANSHAAFGWQKLTDTIILAAAALPQRPVFVLWGGFAGKKAALLPEDSRVLLSAHPSPLSAYRGFFGSKPFSKVNALLGENAIRW